MVTREEAVHRVDQRINRPDPYWPDKPRIVILAECTIEREWGWVFFYQSSRYLETDDPGDALAGNAPYMVNKESGELIETGTALPIEHYMEEYEKKINL